jgi:hypothetical protein
MEKQPRTLGRAYLVGKLRERGLSRRQAVVVVNVILERMIKALRRGEEVEFPIGKLRRVRRHFSNYWDGENDWPANRQGYTVEWYLDKEGLRLLFPEEWASAPKQRRRSSRRRTG